MIINNGTVFCDDGVFRNVDIEARNGVIAAIGENLTNNEGGAIDAKDHYVIPGFVDIHNHGAMSADFSDGTPEAIDIIAKHHLKTGVTSFLGTTISLPIDRTLKICETARPHVNVMSKDKAVMRGIHLEGPFFSMERRGAHVPEYLHDPDFDILTRFNEATGDNVCIIAVAPELPGAFDFIKSAAKEYTVSLAHSAASYDVAYAGFEAGATHVTHLFNGMGPFNHRDPGLVGASYDYGAYVELITDGIHIHPAVVRAVFDMFDEDRICLISDSMRACGLSDGQYDLGGQAVTVSGRKVSLDNDTLAGSATTLPDCVRSAVEFGIPLEKALKASTINPSKSAGIDKEIGSLTVGKRADILVLDKTLNLRYIIFGGEQI